LATSDAAADAADLDPGNGWMGECRAKKEARSMARYAGRDWTRRELLSRVGNPHQIAGVRSYVFRDGKADGVRAMGVRTGGGLQMTVLPGRGMDIAEAFFRDRALHLFTPVGITSPAYFEEPGVGFLRGFFGGLLTTCGIVNAGAPGMDRGTAFGLHGRISHAGAEDVGVVQEWEGDEYVMRIRGTVREASFMNENISLVRTIETRLGCKDFLLRDLVTNHGYDPQPLMLLYHCNFGFPLMSPRTRLVGPIRSTTARDEEASRGRGVEEALSFPEPVPGYNEKVFFHAMGADGDGNTLVALWNPDAGDGSPLGICLRWNRKELPCFTQWKMPAQGVYVCGLEPGTVTPLGRGVLRDRGELPVLEGQQEYQVSMRFEVLETREELAAVEKEARTLVR
jgi:hypothetical protein